MKPLQGAIYTLPHPPRVCNVTPVRLIKAPWTLYAILSILFQTLLLNLFSLVPHLTLPGLGGGGASGPAASNILMWFFIDLSNWSKISWLFLKFTWENFCQIFFLVISVNHCWRHHFFAKVILVKLKVLYILMQWSKWFIFWNVFYIAK